MRKKPKSEKPYWFVKPTGTGIVAKLFVRFSDGSGILHPDLDGVEYDGTWEELWDFLMREGFVTEQEARLQGTIPSDWVPPHVPWLPI